MFVTSSVAFVPRNVIIIIPETDTRSNSRSSSTPKIVSRSLSLSLFRKLNRKFHLQLELGTSTGGTVIYHNLFSRARAKSGGGEEQKLAPRERALGKLRQRKRGNEMKTDSQGRNELSAIRSPSPASRFSRRWSHFCFAESSPPFFSPPSDIDFHIPFRYFRKKKKKKKKILIFPPSKVTRKYV